MKESKQLVNTLKQELKRQGKTYADLTEVLELSHASVKRVFAECHFTLERLERVCHFLGLDLLELARISEREAEKIDQLTIEQEQELVTDTKFLCVAHALLNRWTVDEITSTYAIDAHEAIRYLARLDRMKLIDLLPGNRVKLLVSHRFSWIKAGPIQHFFEKELQADYFNSTFNKPEELRLFVSSMLSRGSTDLIMEKMKKLADEVNQLHLQDEKLSLESKRGTSVLIAIRPWETRVFSALRRV